MKKAYTFRECDVLASTSTNIITDFLNIFNGISEIINVEKEKEYQKKDIDLIVKTINNSEYSVEVKADRCFYTQNFFFETVSNTKKNTEGCFMYSQADYLFYFYTGVNKLYSIPFRAARKWFLENIEDFKERTATTKVSKGNYYQSRGRLVPRNRLISEVEDVKIYDLNKYANIS